MKRKRVSLSSEIHYLMLAIQGLRVLAVRVTDAPEDPEARLIALSLASLTTLVAERLRLVGRAVRGDVDPTLIWNRDNKAEGMDDAVTLTSWEPKLRGRARGRDGP